MLGFTALPGTLMFLGYQQLPESPCWLVSADQVEQAKDVLDLIRSTDEEVLDEMQAIITSTRKNYRNEAKAESTMDQLKHMISNPPTRRALFLGCGMMVLQQGIGINTVCSQWICTHHDCVRFMPLLHCLSAGHVLFSDNL